MGLIEHVICLDVSQANFEQPLLRGTIQQLL